MEIICHQRKKVIVCLNTLSQLCHLLVPSTNIKPHLPPAHRLQVRCVGLNTEDKSPFSHLLCLLVRKETDIFHVAIDVKKYKEGKGKGNVGKEAASDKVTFQQRIKSERKKQVENNLDLDSYNRDENSFVPSGNTKPDEGEEVDRG